MSGLLFQTKIPQRRRPLLVEDTGPGFVVRLQLLLGVFRSKVGVLAAGPHFPAPAPGPGVLHVLGGQGALLRASQILLVGQGGRSREDRFVGHVGHQAILVLDLRQVARARGRLGGQLNV